MCATYTHIQNYYITLCWVVGMVGAAVVDVLNAFYDVLGASSRSAFL